MFGHDSDPSRIYAYGARDPVEGGERALELLRLARRYQNRLTEIEAVRWAARNAALAEIPTPPELAEVEAALERLVAEKQALGAALRERRQRERQRVHDPAARARSKTIGEEVKALKARRKALRAAIWTSPAWLEAQKRFDGEALAARKRARAESGLAPGAWGTYLATEQASEQACRDAKTAQAQAAAHRANAKAVAQGREPRAIPGVPRFRRWDGEGKLALQFQGGLFVREALAGTDARLRIEVPEGGIWVEGTRRPRRLGTAWAYVRIDGEGRGKKRRDVVLKLPFHLHRPLPEDAAIKWLWVVRRRIGLRYRWGVQFVLSRASGWDPPDRATTGVVGIDLGWRQLDDGRLRVAYAVGSDGVEVEVTLPAEWREAMRWTDELQSRRKRALAEAREAFAAFWEGRPEFPVWLAERTAGRDREAPLPTKAQALARVRAILSAAKLAGLVLAWREARVAGDETAFAAAEWRRHDKRLLEEAANLRDKLQGQRREIYRVLAAGLRRRYAACVLEGRDLREPEPERLMDLRAFHQNRPAERDEGEEAVKAARLAARDACVSSLRQYLSESLRVVTTPATDTTRRCHACGRVNDWDQAREVEHTCDGCGTRWDQDVNAARNLLASTGTVTESREPLATP